MFNLRIISSFVIFFLVFNHSRVFLMLEFGVKPDFNLSLQYSSKSCFANKVSNLILSSFSNL